MLALERGAASMGAAVSITRLDLTASELRKAASGEKDGAAARRILALALVLDGLDRKMAAETCGMNRQTLRDWVHRYNAEGLAGLRNLKSPGPGSKLTARQQAELAELVEAGRPRGARGSALAAGRSAQRIAAALRCRATRAFGREGSGQARLPQAVGKAPPPAGRRKGPRGV